MIAGSSTPATPVERALPKSFACEPLEILRQVSVKPSELLTLSQFLKATWKIYVYANNSETIVYKLDAGFGIPGDFPAVPSPILSRTRSNPSGSVLSKK
jgi:hypothetical protein